VVYAFNQSIFKECLWVRDPQSVEGCLIYLESDKVFGLSMNLKRAGKFKVFIYFSKKC
jgi:hypothetical protein